MTNETIKSENAFDAETIIAEETVKFQEETAVPAAAPKMGRFRNIGRKLSRNASRIASVGTALALTGLDIKTNGVKFSNVAGGVSGLAFGNFYGGVVDDLTAYTHKSPVWGALFSTALTAACTTSITACFREHDEAVTERVDSLLEKAKELTPFSAGEETEAQPSVDDIIASFTPRN